MASTFGWHARVLVIMFAHKGGCGQGGSTLSRSKLSVLTVSVWKLTVLTVYRFYRLPFCRLPFWAFCHFGFTVLHFALSNFTGRFAVLPVSVLPFCRSVSPFCRSWFAVLANSVLIPFTVLTAESWIKCIPFCRFRFDRFDVHFLLPIWKFRFPFWRSTKVLTFDGS